MNKRRTKYLNKKLKLLERLNAQKSKAIANDKYSPEEAMYQAYWYDVVIKEVQRPSDV